MNCLEGLALFTSIGCFSALGIIYGDTVPLYNLDVRGIILVCTGSVSTLFFLIRMAWWIEV